LRSSGSRVISAIISRSSGDKTDDESCAPFGKSALVEVVEGWTTTEESVCFFFFWSQRVWISGIQECMREKRTNQLIRLVRHKSMILIVYGRRAVRRGLWRRWGRERIDDVGKGTVPVCKFRVRLHGRRSSKHVDYVINPPL
jgi:hypothetical protein